MVGTAIVPLHICSAVKLLHLAIAKANCSVYRGLIARVVKMAKYSTVRFYRVGCVQTSWKSYALKYIMIRECHPLFLQCTVIV